MRKKISFTGDTAILLYIAAATTIAHLLVSGNYGYFIDELYTLACSRHLSLAFVDIPPVVPTLTRLVTLVFGDSLTAIHILPSIFSGAAVIIVGMMARELGGGRKAVIFAGLCAAFVPVWMALGSLGTYDFMDQTMIMLLLYLTIRLLNRENPKTWLWIGLTAGLGVMTKPSMVFFIMGLALALLFTRHRRQYATKWPWLGAAIALFIISPSLIWQAVNGFPIARYWGEYSQSQALHVSPLEFIMMQVVVSNIVLLPVWSTGLYSFLFGKGKKFRLLGVLCCVLFGVFMLTGAKVYMPAPLYAVMLAGGAVAIERFAAGKRWTKVLIPVFSCVIVLMGVVQAPLFMPVLPVESLVRYCGTVGVALGFDDVKLGSNVQTDVLPQYMYDRFDWDTAVRDIADVYQSLPPEEKENVTIASPNYGYAGAVDLMGGQYGLPHAFSTTLNYYLFSKDNLHDGTWIVVDMSYGYLKHKFKEVTFANQIVSKYKLPHRMSIYICRGPRFDVEKARTDITEFYLDD